MAAESTDDGQWPTVADPEEYNQTQRLRAINQARQRVEDTLEQSMIREVTNPDFTESDRRKIVRAVVYSYVSNVLWLMVEAGRADLVKEADLGQVKIEPPERFVELAKERSRGYPRVVGSPSLRPYVYQVEGIQGYLAAPEVFEETWTIQVQRRHSRPEPVSDTKEMQMPIHISKNAFTVANRFCSESGIDVSLDRGKPHGEI